MATASATTRPPPVAPNRMKQIAQDACDSALQNASSYVHSQTATWNNTIINRILESLVASGNTSSAPSGNTQYKYAVNSTIIQHLTDRELTDSSTSTDGGESNLSIKSTNPHPANTELRSEPGVTTSDGPPGSESVKPEKGRRGMHSATGAFWNNETDGMWSFKWQGAEKKGMDVVVSIIWVAV